MSTASIARTSAASLFREVARADQPKVRAVPVAMTPANAARPLDVRRWIDLSLVPVAGGVWLYVLGVFAAHL